MPRSLSDLDFAAKPSDSRRWDRAHPICERSPKLPAGAAVVYAASTHHRVTPVTRGQRPGAATWARSYVRDPAIREVLFDLETVLRNVTAVPPIPTPCPSR